jgi:hypothetical protein
MTIEQKARKIIELLDSESEDLSKKDYLELLEELHSDIGGRIDAVEDELTDEEID